MKIPITYIVLALGVLALALGAVWFFFFRSSAPAQTNTAGNNFQVPADTVTNPVNTTETPNTTQPINTAGQVSQQKIFQITAGPVVGATLIQTLHPTTTLARYINQEDGHVYDLPLDVPGAVPRVVSNVTIPGGVRAVWVEGGAAAIMQYLDGVVVKSVYLGFPAATTSAAAATLPTRIKFLPDATVDLAASPDGKSVVYLLKTASGVDGYTAKDDGTGSKKLFSLPLSQMLISWPSQSTLMAQTKSAAGVPGIIFSIDVKTGAVTPLVYAQGITASANNSFSALLYQTSDGSTLTSYLHNIKNGLNVAAPINPLPEQCVWGVLQNLTLYCAAPAQAMPANYFDLWHMGNTGAPDYIFRISALSDSVTLVIAPGSGDGGIPSDVTGLSLSPDEHYLSFTTKGSRAVWGVRLGSQ